MKELIKISLLSILMLLGININAQANENNIPEFMVVTYDKYEEFYEYTNKEEFTEELTNQTSIYLQINMKKEKKSKYYFVVLLFAVSGIEIRRTSDFKIFLENDSIITTDVIDMRTTTTYMGTSGTMISMMLPLYINDNISQYKELTENIKPNSKVMIRTDGVDFHLTSIQVKEFYETIQFYLTL